MSSFLHRSCSLRVLKMGRTRTISTDTTSNGTPRILIAGLGNAPFPDTRHSVGQRIINSLSSHLDIPLKSMRGGHVGTNPSGTITLFKSKQFMNATGPSVIDALRKAGVSHTHLILVYDSLTHAPMTLSVRLGGSAQGHNGVKSVMQRLGATATTKMFWQFRVGIGRGEEAPGTSGKQRKELGKGVDAAEWVLGKMSAEELKFWGPEGDGIPLVLKEVQKVVRRLSEEGEAKPPGPQKEVILEAVEQEGPSVSSTERERVQVQVEPSG